LGAPFQQVAPRSMASRSEADGDSPNIPARMELSRIDECRVRLRLPGL